MFDNHEPKNKKIRKETIKVTWRRLIDFLKTKRAENKLGLSANNKTIFNLFSFFFC